jgi:putative transposase
MACQARHRGRYRNVATKHIWIGPPRPQARTWARRGHTPVVRVSGKDSGRVSVAGLVCLKPGHRGHVFYRLRIHYGREGERRSLSEDDYATLITAAHRQLHAPIILIWHIVNTHTTP